MANMKVLTHIDMDSSKVSLFKEAGFVDTNNQPPNIFNPEWKMYITADEYAMDSSAAGGHHTPELPDTGEAGIRTDSFFEAPPYLSELALIYPMCKGLKGYSSQVLRESLDGYIPESKEIDPVSFTMPSDTDLRYSVFQNYFGTYSTDTDMHYKSSLIVRTEDMSGEPWVYSGETPVPLIRNILSDTRGLNITSTGASSFKMTHRVGLEAGDYCLSAYAKHDAGSSAKVSMRILDASGNSITSEPISSMEHTGALFTVDDFWKDMAISFHVTEGIYTVEIVWSDSKTAGDVLKLSGIQLDIGRFPKVFCFRQKAKEKTYHPIMFDFAQGISNPMQRTFAITYKRYSREGLSGTLLDTLGTIRYGYSGNQVVIGNHTSSIPSGYDPVCKWERVTIVNDPINRKLTFWSTGKTWDIKMGEYTYNRGDLTASVYGMPVNLILGADILDGHRSITTSAYKDLCYYADDFDIAKIKNSYMALSFTGNKSVLRSFDWEEEY